MVVIELVWLLITAKVMLVKLVINLLKRKIIVWVAVIVITVGVMVMIMTKDISD